MTKLRWGLLGTGNIARQFADGLVESQRGIVTAVGSRQQASADAFAHRHRIGNRHASYEALLADPEVDAIYVSTPNSLHFEWTIKALEAGKHVLCEKPMANKASEAAEMFATAKAKGKVLLEAFMYRMHPQTAAVMQLIRSGAIGELRYLRTSFCFRTSKVSGNVRFDAGLAGGALMDVGCYCTNLSLLMAGESPESIHVVGNVHESGVDEFASGILRFPGGLVSSFCCGLSLQADNTAMICGTEGYIELGWPWKPPARGAVISVAKGVPPRMDNPSLGAPRRSREEFTVDAGKSLYALEADAFAACVFDDAPLPVPASDTLANLTLLEEARRQIGVAF